MALKQISGVVTAELSCAATSRCWRSLWALSLLNLKVLTFLTPRSCYPLLWEVRRHKKVGSDLYRSLRYDQKAASLPGIRQLERNPPAGYGILLPGCGFVHIGLEALLIWEILSLR